MNYHSQSKMNTVFELNISLKKDQRLNQIGFSNTIFSIEMVLMFLVVCSLHAMGASKMEKTWLWNFQLNNPSLDIYWISIMVFPNRNF